MLYVCLTGHSWIKWDCKILIKCIYFSASQKDVNENYEYENQMTSNPLNIGGVWNICCHFNNIFEHCLTKAFRIYNYYLYEYKTLIFKLRKIQYGCFLFLL